ncbi:hypothetical protein PSV08DRAFT_405786 [Bipolaris maydis]|uniref:uncharacterized protein n=1 Tax=Cochliobolus heterostrophus TaxID=5016 RepID=UPI0024D6774D|nr:hypothetical protein PSV08DRAFT_405786 [Bipolaris maydis]
MHSHGRLLFWLLFCLLCIASACVAILEGASCSRDESAPSDPDLPLWDGPDQHMLVQASSSPQTAGPTRSCSTTPHTRTSRLDRAPRKARQIPGRQSSAQRFVPEAVSGGAALSVTHVLGSASARVQGSVARHGCSHVKISGQGEEAAEPHAHGWSDPACEGCLPPMHDVRRTHVDMAAVPLSKKNLRALPPRCGMLAESAPVPVASLLHLHARPRERPVTSIPQSLRLGSLLPAHQPPRNHVYGYTDDSAWPSACKPLLGPCRRSARFATVGKSQTLRPSSLRIPTQPPSRCLYP